VPPSRSLADRRGFADRATVVTNKNVGQLMTKGYVAPGYVDDESEGATSWVDVVRKKRPSGPSSLVGNQSVAMLTLFTKPKVVN
jgi:hypothetical protein